MTQKDDRLYGRFTLDFPDSAKIAPLSDAAFRALVEMTLYSRRMLTDGFIAKRLALAKWGLETCQELASNDDERPSLIEVDNGYQIHDFAKHQSTSAEIADLSAKRKAAGQKGGRAKAVARAKQKATKTYPETETETETETHKEPASAGSTRTRRPTMSITEMATGKPETPPPPAPAELQRGVPATTAADIVRQELPRNRYQPATLTALRHSVGQLLAEGNDEHVIRAALRLWDARPDGGPGLLPHLLAEAAKGMSGTHNTGQRKPSRHQEKTAAHADLFDRFVAEGQAAQGITANTQPKELLQ